MVVVAQLQPPSGERGGAPRERPAPGLRESLVVGSGGRAAPRGRWR